MAARGKYTLSAWQRTRDDVLDPVPVLCFNIRKEDREVFHARLILSIVEQVKLPVGTELMSFGFLATDAFEAEQVSLPLLKALCCEIIDNHSALLTPSDKPDSSKTMEKYNEEMLAIPQKAVRRQLTTRYPEKSICIKCLYNIAYLYVKACLQYHHLKHVQFNHKLRKDGTLKPLLTRKGVKLLSPFFGQDETFTGWRSHNYFRHNVQKAMMQETMYVTSFIERYKFVTARILLVVDHETVLNLTESKLVTSVLTAISEYLEMPFKRKVNWMAILSASTQMIYAHYKRVPREKRMSKCKIFALLKTHSHQLKIYGIDVQTGKIVFHTQ